jgi:pyruvate-formate lyase
MSIVTATQTGPLDRELAFTDTYRRYQNEHKAIREAMCMRAYGRQIHPIRPGDVFAGRHMKAQHDPDGMVLGFGLEQDDSGVVYWCDADRLRRRILTMDVDEAYRRRAKDMLAFWESENTLAKHMAMLPADVRDATTNTVASQGIRLSGALVNFDKLIRIGIGGLRAQVEAHRRAAKTDGRDVGFYQGMLLALDLLAEVCRDYAEQAAGLAGAETNHAWRRDLEVMAADLAHVVEAPPATFRQAVQLFWLYSVMTGVANLGRMDVYLGDLYAQDIDSGALAEEEALRLLVALWDLIADAKRFFNSRVFIGGRGRRNEANADRFALLAMEATRVAGRTEPQLSLRLYEGQNPALMQKALDVIGKGCVYPMLYNDDVNVPAVEKAFRVPREDAEQYFAYGCGEYALDHIAFGSPNSGFNLLRALEVVMHNGVDPWTGKAVGIKTGDFTAFETFEQLWDAYAAQVEHHVARIAGRHAIEYETERQAASFLYLSMLFDDCLERGKSIVDGGARYRGSIVESVGMVNTADSLTAVKKLVFDEKRLTPAQLIEMLDANWEGFERERRLFLDAPKYGNDDETADSMMRRVSEHACRATIEQAARVGLDYSLLVNINNFIHVEIGKHTAATPDGRRSGDPIANGGTPTAGNDRSGVTAFLNSIAKPDPSLHAGYVHNMKFSRRMFGEHRGKLEALLDVYFSAGGTQAMITAVDRGDLENAMKEPEKYRSLIVRVGGFSAHFVELEPALQRDIIKRTLYD